jgi:hypothetical protein
MICCPIISNSYPCKLSSDMRDVKQKYLHIITVKLFQGLIN